MSYILKRTGSKLDELLDDLSSKSSTFAYLSASADTTITTPIDWYAIQGTFINDFEDFELDTDKIKYTGDEKYKFEIDWHAKLASDTVATKINITVSVNGTPVETSKMGAYLKTADEPIAVSGTEIVTLEKNDTVQLVVQADKACDLTFGFFVTGINKFIMTREV